MEFIPRKPAPAPLDARQRLIREAGVAAVAAALGLAEGAGNHAAIPASAPLPKAA